jgi:hypothetical protein
MLPWMMYTGHLDDKRYPMKKEGGGIVRKNCEIKRLRLM